MNIDLNQLAIEKLEEEEDFNIPIIETKINMLNFCSYLIDDFTILDQMKDCVDLNIVKTHFKNLGRLSKPQALKILNDAKLILKDEPNNLVIDREVHIFGDIHGQYFDLVNLIENFDLSKDCLIFLGDYVDRGIYSTETFLYLALLKIYYRDNIFLLRGNHESRSMTSKYTFKTECLYKYDEEVFESFISTFNTLPLSAVILDSLFCIHGGLVPGLERISDIDNINRFTNLEKGSLLRDMLWADPHPDLQLDENLVKNEILNSPVTDIENKITEDNEIGEDTLYIKNKRRSYFFTHKSVCKFLEENNLQSIIRAHEHKDEGYELYKPYKNHPSVVTLFSAPNYCDEHNNKGAVLHYDGINMNILQFEGVSHPKLLPNNLDGINWTFPFISEKISEFYITLLRSLQNSEKINELQIESEIVKSARMQLSMILIRTERENIGSGDCKSDIFMDKIKVNKNIMREDIEDENIKGLSMDISTALLPDLTRRLANISLEKVLKKSLIQYEEENDKGEIYLPKKVPEKGCPVWVFFK